MYICIFINTAALSDPDDVTHFYQYLRCHVCMCQAIFLQRSPIVSWTSELDSRDKAQLVAAIVHLVSAKQQPYPCHPP